MIYCFVFSLNDLPLTLTQDISALLNWTVKQSGGAFPCFSGFLMSLNVLLWHQKHDSCWFIKGKMSIISHPRARSLSKSFQSNESGKFAAWHTAACFNSLFQCRPRKSWIICGVYYPLLRSQRWDQIVYDEWPSVPAILLKVNGQRQQI